MSGAPDTLTTPEGLELAFATGSASERLLAIVIDLGILLLALLATTLVLQPTLGGGSAAVAAFLLRVFYFAWFEVRWNGRTIGKRAMSLRVIAADGGPLTTEVVLARNLSREIELFAPLVLLLNPELYLGGNSGWLALLALVWLVLLLAFPLCNQRRLRIGDLLAGTRVVAEPRAALLRDLAARPANAPQSSENEPVFLAAHLAVYGIKELEVLADVLRKSRLPGGNEAVRAVAQSIRKRIGWPDRDGREHGDLTFLRAFYTAQRRHLEHHLLLGRRKEAKQP